MSRYASPGIKSEQIETNSNEAPKLTIKDTDFILKLITYSSIDGRELEQAFSTKNKIKAIHQALSEANI